MSPRPDIPRWEPTLKGHEGCCAPPEGRADARHHRRLLHKVHLPSGAMAAGTASRYKTGPRLATHCILYTSPQ